MTRIRTTLSRTPNQRGFEAVGLLIAVVVVAAIGFVGYKVVSLQQAAPSQASVSTDGSSVPAQIKTKADLTTTSKALDKSSSELDSGLDDTSLDADVNALL